MSDKISSIEIYIARHGQNEDNVEGILNGHRDRPLTELGRDQATQLAIAIQKAGINFDHIYSSPLIRAYDTAKIVGGIVFGANAEPTIIPELIERDFGVMTGVPTKEIDARCSPDIIKTDTVTYFLNSEGAETFPQLIERSQKALDHVRALQQTGTALLVCHGDIGKMIYVAATGKPWEDVLTNFHFGNGDLIEVGPDDDAHKIKLPQYNL